MIIIIFIMIMIVIVVFAVGILGRLEVIMSAKGFLLFSSSSVSFVFVITCKGN